MKLNKIYVFLLNDLFYIIRIGISKEAVID